MAAIKKTPVIRFKGFEEEWEKKTLNSLCSILTKQTGFDYTTTIKPSLVKYFSPDNYSFIQNKDFFGNDVNLKTDFYIPKKIAELYPNILLDKPSILISISGKIGNVGFYQLSKKAFIGGPVGICKLLAPSDGLFILYNLLSDKGQKYFQSLIKASSHSNITVEDIRKIPIYLPTSKLERPQIGNYFKGLDGLIHLEEQKLEKLTNLKKAMLDKMFPKDGADIPEIRFKGFSEKWKKKKLGEVGSVAMNKRIFKHQTKEIGEVPFFKIGTFGGKADAFISRGIFEDYKAKYPYPDKGDILISASGSIGKTVEYLGVDEYFQDSNIVWLKHDNSVLNIFLKYFYSIVKWSGLEGSTIKRLYNSNILNTCISLPSIQEQQKIGEYFQNLDQLINQFQEKIEQLKHLKQALLQKMFI